MSVNISSFNSAFKKIVVLSIAIIALLILLVTVRGAHIREATFNPELPTQFSGEWLVLHTDQPLKTIQTKNVKITPSTPIKVISSGNEVAIQFEQRLPYNTNYKINIQSNPVNLNYSFKTPKGIIYYLVGVGTIKGHTLNQANDRTVYSAPFINTFALTGNNMAVVDQHGSTDQLVIVNTNNGDSYQVPLPERGTIQQLRASPDGQDFSFTFTSLSKKAKPYYDSSLLNYSVTLKKVSPIYGFNHKLLKLTDWSYSPDGTVILAQTFSSVVEAVYLNGSTPPLPIGAYGIISGFSYNGGDIYVGTLTQGLEKINVSTRKVSLLNQSPLGLNSQLLAVYPLVNDSGYIEMVQKAIPNEANLGQYVFLKSGSTTKQLFASVNGSDDVAGISISPNDEYISIGVTPTVFSQINKGIPASTLIVSVASGKVIDRIPSLEQGLWQ